MDIETLVKLTARGWSVPILAAMHAGTPGRQAALLAATGAGRSVFGQSLDHLIALGLVERSAGHGHPLRPEFQLTAAGQAAAAMAERILTLTPAAERTLLRRAWTLPVLVRLTHPKPFSEIKQGLPITDRALSQSLKRLETCAWVARRITDGRPPRPVYRASGTGLALAVTLRNTV